MRILFLSVITSFFSGLAQGSTCPSLAGIYSRENEHVCAYSNGKEFRCVDLVIVTQNGCSEYSVLEKPFVINGDSSLGYSYAERQMVFSAIMSSGAKSSHYVGDFPVLTEALLKTDMGFYKTQFVTPSDLIVYTYNGFAKHYYQSKMSLAGDRLIVEKRDAPGIANGTSYYTPGTWSAWNQVLSVSKFSDKLPDSIWNTYESGFPNLKTKMDVFFKDGSWNTVAVKDGDFTPIPLDNWKSVNLNPIKSVTDKLDKSKKYSCLFKAHRLDIMIDSRYPEVTKPVYDTIFVESVDSCLEVQ